MKEFTPEDESKLDSHIDQLLNEAIKQGQLLRALKEKEDGTCVVVYLDPRKFHLYRQLKP
ncbi:MAG: hypothetical protein QNJ46_18125 [Leptolyngbyaceae cyanobacterium MO_188.B28]|nr:hypothetical protein [Leptolyngbyaceae cyanobacterium MO_188.B28]